MDDTQLINTTETHWNVTIFYCIISNK